MAKYCTEKYNHLVTLLLKYLNDGKLSTSNNA